ncbi:unnamed protein product [Sphagnum jensenii]|uniref:Uncharacterized protein n=1 Tax=Sphagnum jensenii TaxID=128206 RepID=A0ABP0WMH5_9BRYO
MPFGAFTGLAGAPDLAGAAEAMSKRSQEECLIELKMKIHRWGFDNNDLSSIEKNKGNIQEAMAAILDYLKIWENCSIIGRWCDQLLAFSSLVEKPPTLSDTATSSLTAGESLLQKRKHGGISGSYQCVQQINKKKTDRKTNALERVVKKMGEESLNALKETWNAMKTGYGEVEWEQGEGVILGLMAQGYSDREIKALLGVGGSRVSRLRKIHKDGMWDGSHTRRPMKVPHHALSSDDLTAFIEDCKTWELEDGFPCSHRRPRQYFVEAKLTWTELWKRYEKKMVSLERRVMSFSRWTQYIKLHQPGVRLTRMAKDVCDSCVRIDIQLARDDLSPEEREHLVLEKGMHLQAAIDQRRFMSGFVKQYITANAPQQPVPNAIIPDTIDDAPPDPIDDASPEIQIQIEDFDGSFSLPFYGHQRPSADYFNSNLMMQNFIISDITANRNNVLIYDERG